MRAILLYAISARPDSVALKTDSKLCETTTVEATMDQDDKTGNVTATIQEIARYNMVLTEAIFELLAEKGILTGVEVKDRVEKLKTETKLQFRWLQ